MKKIFLYSVLLILIGNTIITILEKFIYSSSDLQKLQIALLNNDLNNNVFVANLLFTKIKIWIFAFSAISCILYFINPTAKTTIKQLIILFYIMACTLNMVITPHPIWLYVAVIPVVVVPILLVDNLLKEIYQLALKLNTNNKTANTQKMNTIGY